MLMEVVLAELEQNMELNQLDISISMQYTKNSIKWLSQFLSIRGLHLFGSVIAEQVILEACLLIFQILKAIKTIK